MFIVVFIAILAVLILSHEFGHFIIAKAAGIRVDEFGMGLPPRAIGRKWGETLYSLNWIPFGGFVRIYGEDADAGVGSFVKKSKLVQIAVVSGGVIFNLFLALALFWGGLQMGMPIDVSQFPQYASNIENQRGVGEIVLGEARFSPVQAALVAPELTYKISVATADALLDFLIKVIKGEGSLEGLVGPVGIAGIVKDASEHGFVTIMLITAILSVSLAVINLVPFPALDGGRLLFIIIEAVKGTPVRQSIVNVINIAGFSLLIILMLFVTYRDIAKLVTQ